MAGLKHFILFEILGESLPHLLICVIDVQLMKENCKKQRFLHFVN